MSLASSVLLNLEDEYWDLFNRHRSPIDNSLPFGILWFDSHSNMIFMNFYMLNKLNLLSYRDVSNIDFIYQSNADYLHKDLSSVLQDVYQIGDVLEGECNSINQISKIVEYWRIKIYPVKHHENNCFMGSYCILNNITNEKQSILLKDELECLSLRTLEEISLAINNYRVGSLKQKINPDNYTVNQPRLIKLSKREKQILFLLSLHKSAKEISEILSIVENKSISSGTIYSIIGKSLYKKFNVSTNSLLLETASIHNYIPLTLK